MAIPGFQTIMLPLLELASDKEEHNINDTVEELAEYFNLTEEEKSILLQSGQQPRFYNRVGWARTYLKKAMLLEYTRRGHFKITDRGIGVLKSNPDKINIKYLKQFPEFVEFKESSKESVDVTTEEDEISILSPEETLEDAYQKIQEDLAEELLGYVMKSTPGFFEKLVVELLVNMGYGGSRREAARAVGRRGDEGIDGIIDEDRLGLDAIYIQAKRWKRDSSIGRPEIQKFVGALTGQRAKKGIFITTSKFTDEALTYARSIDTKVVLIDGMRLANLMIDYDVGVSHRTTYKIKSVDSDYFGESAGE